MTSTQLAALAVAGEMGSSEEQVSQHLQRMPGGYADAVAPRTVVRHALMLANTMPGEHIITRVSPAEGPDAAADLDDLDVIAADRPGLFAKVAGVIALNGGQIVDAEAFTRDDGVVVDTFRVRAPEGAGGSWWARVEGDLTDAAAGRLAVRARVAAMAAADRARVTKRSEVATHVDIDGHDLVVRAVNRLGVLYAISSALAELDVDIVNARIASLNGEIHDRFAVRNAQGETLDADHAAEVIRAIDHAISAL